VRRLLVLTVLWLLAAPAAAQPAPVVVPGSPRCGGMTLLIGRYGESCVHATGDLYDGRAEAPWRGVPPATAPVPCYGDGTTGPRVQLLYGYIAGRPNRAAEVRRQAWKEMAPRMQAVIRAASGGKDLAIRFAFEPGCAGLSVPVVRLPASVGKGTPDARFTTVIEVLHGLGYTRRDRRYEVLLDGWTSNGVCGLGELAPAMDQPHPANVHDGVPTVGGHTDVPSTVGAPDDALLPRYSAVWHSTFGRNGPDCWQLGQSHASVQVHELFHTLGAVQLSAPNSDGGGHCTDMPSVMCSNAKPTVRACTNRPVEVLDCGQDDYWNPSPPSGSYLATGDNIATSVFFGPQPQDRFAALPF